MKPKFEGVVYFLGGIIRTFDFCTDTFYVFTQDFTDEWLRYVAAGFLVCPTIFFLFLFLCIGMGDLCRGRRKDFCMKFCSGFFLGLFDPIGITLCIFGTIFLVNKQKAIDYYTVEALTRSAGLVEAVFESFPQLVIQSYNNQVLDQWDLFTITSVGFSVISFMYTCLKLLIALDHVNQYTERKVHSDMKKEMAEKQEAEGNLELVNIQRDEEDPEEYYQYSED